MGILEDKIQGWLDFLKFGDIQTDGVAFKLFSKLAVGVCFAGALLCVATQYFGDPIVCTKSWNEKFSEDFVKSHCWIHGSSWIGEFGGQNYDSTYQKTFGCITDQETVTQDSDTSYYQWVVFMLFIHGVLFMLPSLIWNYLEGGLMADFGTEAKSALVTADPGTLEQRLDTYTKHFKSLGTAYKNHYLASYLLCWLLNVAATVLNFVLANQFLDGKFRSYGMDVIHYYGKDIDTRSDEMNPLCNAFPTKVRCDISSIVIRFDQRGEAALPAQPKHHQPKDLLGPLVCHRRPPRRGGLGGHLLGGRVHHAKPEGRTIGGDDQEGIQRQRKVSFGGSPTGGAHVDSGRVVHSDPVGQQLQLLLLSRTDQQDGDGTRI